jgi:translation initiation factor 1 (eIF-1/SUI1)
MTVSKRTQGKISVDYGMPNYYKYYTTISENPVSNVKFNKIVTEFNAKIVDLLVNDGLEFAPATLGIVFCIRKSKRIPRIKDGKLINTNPVDWKTTKELWDSDEESKLKKIRIRFLNNHTSKYVFRIKALKAGKLYKNKRFYRFKACRSFQRNLAKRILDTNQDNFEAFELY